MRTYDIEVVIGIHCSCGCHCIVGIDPIERQCHVSLAHSACEQQICIMRAPLVPLSQESVFARSLAEIDSLADF